MAEQLNNSDAFNTNEEDRRNGRDIPGGDGTIADEDVDAISGDNVKNAKTGQDHSLENYGESMPTGGVGGVQDYSDTTSDIARIKE